MNKGSSYSAILRSSAAMGAASLIQILVGLVRIKVAAVLLGPAGIGLIGLMQNMITSASIISALGLDTAGTRQIAKAAGEGRDDDIAAARQALFLGTLILSLVGGTIFFLLRHRLSMLLFGDATQADQIGWLTLAVVLTIASGSQGALLQGLRRIGDLALLKIASGVFATLVGVTALVVWREDGLVLFLIAVPLVSFILGHWFVLRLKMAKASPIPLKRLAQQWRVMLGLGAALMATALLTSIAFLVARGLIQRALGAAELGLFQAAWTISMTYIGFVLSAMATDYYPRLTASIHDHQAAARLINEQTEIALLLAGPVLIAMMALAPLVIQVFFTPEFAKAAEILRWQVLGNILKIASWPLGFVFLASGAGKTYVITEGTAVSVFFLITWIGLDWIGITATGIGFLVMYMIYLPLVFLLVQRQVDFRWQAGIVRQILLLISATGSLMVLAQYSELMAAIAGCMLAAVFALHGLARLAMMVEVGGLAGRLARLSRKTIN